MPYVASDTSASKPKPMLAHIFSRFANTRALVVGDVMLDTYWWGESNRISPEAPVPVVNIYKTEHRLGGAANVALNLQSLGAKVSLLAVTGNDTNGKLILQLMKDHRLSSNYILQSEERITTQKNRIMSSNRQALRYDVESTHDLSAKEMQSVKQLFDKIMRENKTDVIVLQDYNKGMLSAPMIRYVIAAATSKNIPIAVDPKKNNFFEYQRVALFKPNLKELREALHTDVDKNKTEQLFAACEQLNKKINCEKILLTLSEKGILGYSATEHFLLPAYERNIADVSGAGDTVIAVAALCISQQLDFELTARLANIAGGLVCETAGVTPVNKEKLMQQAAMLLS
jgi:rfaE bifunctional protein kinase chain/domain